MTLIEGLPSGFKGAVYIEIDFDSCRMTHVRIFLISKLFSL